MHCERARRKINFSHAYASTGEAMNKVQGRTRTFFTLKSTVIRHCAQCGSVIPPGQEHWQDVGSGLSRLDFSCGGDPRVL